MSSLFKCSVWCTCFVHLLCKHLGIHSINILVICTKTSYMRTIDKLRKTINSILDHANIVFWGSSVCNTYFHFKQQPWSLINLKSWFSIWFSYTCIIISCAPFIFIICRYFCICLCFKYLSVLFIGPSTRTCNTVIHCLYIYATSRTS